MANVKVGGKWVWIATLFEKWVDVYGRPFLGDPKDFPRSGKDLGIVCPKAKPPIKGWAREVGLANGVEEEE